ncbi:MAG TPA: LysR family transcriptional regulator [Kofleriaceae bacterium]|jgi:DNA-binding transcriptional LysR family regulator
MDLNDIVLFTKLVESKTLTSAADQLGIPKSTVSRRLSQLEGELGVKLFERNTRHFTLTDVGMAYYVRCSEIVGKVTEANQFVTDMQVSPRGRVRMTAPTDLSSRYLGRILGEFAKLHPEINVELFVSDKVMSLPEDGFDLALRIHDSSDPTNGGKLMAHKLTPLTGVLCASPSYLEQHGVPEKIEDLYTRPLLVWMPDGVHSFKLTDGTATMELAPPARMVANYYAPIRDALVAGAGIGAMADYAVARELASGELVRVLPTWAGAPYDIFLVYAARESVPPRIRLLVDHLQKELSPPPWTREPSAESASVEQVKGRGKSSRVSRTDVEVEDRGNRRAVSR